MPMVATILYLKISLSEINYNGNMTTAQSDTLERITCDELMDLYKVAQSGKSKNLVD